MNISRFVSCQVARQLLWVAQTVEIKTRPDDVVITLTSRARVSDVAIVWRPLVSLIFMFGARRPPVKAANAVINQAERSEGDRRSNAHAQQHRSNGTAVTEVLFGSA